MKIIDEKGRLFSKINIIDFLVLLFVLCLMPMFYFFWKIMNKPALLPQPPTITLDKVEYENEINVYKSEIIKLKNVRDNFLRENKRARKYFD